MELAPYLYKEYGYTAYDLLKIIKYYGYNFYDSNFKKISSIDEYIRKINKGSSKIYFLPKLRSFFYYKYLMLI